MSYIKYALFGMLFFQITCRCVINWMPSFGLSLISTTLVGMGYLCTLLCISKFSVKNIPGSIKKLSILFCVYTTFVVFQLYISPTIKLDDINSVPNSLFSYLLSSIVLLLMMLSVGLMRKYFNAILFAKITSLLILLFLVAYHFRIGFEWYALTYGMKLIDLIDFVPSGFIDGLQMGNYVGLLFACNLFLADKWTKNKSINIIITIVIGLLCLSIDFIMIERGPILFQLVTIFIFLYSKRIISARNTIGILSVLIILFIFNSFILEKLSIMSPEMIEKISETGDSGGSGRYGSGYSLYGCAIDQIIKNPLFGSHCRMTHVIWLGSYPHNIFLELLMTFGIVFSIPTIYFILKAFTNAFRMLRANTQDSLFAIIYILTTLCLLTSYSILDNMPFWVSFAYVLSYPQLKKRLMKI